MKKFLCIAMTVVFVMMMPLSAFAVLYRAPESYIWQAIVTPITSTGTRGAPLTFNYEYGVGKAQQDYATIPAHIISDTKWVKYEIVYRWKTETANRYSVLRQGETTIPAHQSPWYDCAQHSGYKTTDTYTRTQIIENREINFTLFTHYKSGNSYSPGQSFEVRFDYER